MLKYFTKRLLQAIPTLFIVITIAFFMMRLAPGGPFTGERSLPPEIEKNIKAAYDLDKPLIMQYFIYLKKIAHGDFGPSFKYTDFSVTELIKTGFPVSMKLGISAIILALILGVTLGSVAAIKQNSALDYALMGVSMIGIAIPNFVLAPILTLLIGVYLKLLPVGGYNDGALANMILPVISLALPQVAYVARLMRASMVEVLSLQFINTARAKGLPMRLVVFRHALKSALLPVVSYLGPATAAIITGSIVIEQIYGLPGLGRYFVQGALNRDYTLVMGTVIFFGTLIIVFNLIVDLVYGFLDPQIRYD